MFPLEVKEGYEGDNSDEFERGFAFDCDDMPGMLSIAKLLD